MKTVVFVLMIVGFHNPVLLDGFSSKEKCEAAYEKLLEADVNSIAGTKYHIDGYEHICVEIIK